MPERSGQRPQRADEPAEWLILHGGALGDLALTLQLALRLARPGPPARLILASRTSLTGLEDAHPPVTHVSPDSLGAHWLYMTGDEPHPPRLAELVRDRIVLNALGSPESPTHRRLSSLNPRSLLSFDPRVAVTPASTAHVLEVWAARLRPSPADPRPPRPPDSPPLIATSPDLRLRGRTWLGAHGLGMGNGRPTVLMHVGSGGRQKCWPVECFLTVGRLLRERGLSVGMLAGPVELESRADLLRSAHPSMPIVPCEETGSLLASLAAADVYLGNDAGPTHVAALLGLPTTAIFGPTSSAVWGPTGVRVRALQGSVELGPEWGVDPATVARAVQSDVG